MAAGRRLSALAAGTVAVGTLAGCSYVDPGPPTGEGRRVAAVLLLVLLVPLLVLGGALAWYHLRASPIIGGRPGLVWVAVCWCFLVAAVVGLPGVGFVIYFAAEATTGSATRGGERTFLDLAGFAVVLAAASLCSGLAAVSLGLSVRRGARWSRWVTAILSALIALNLLGVAAQGIDGNGEALLLLLLVFPALAPIPFLFWFGAKTHFSPHRVAPPVPAPEPVSLSEHRSLSDRWHTRG